MEGGRKFVYFREVQEKEQNINSLDIQTLFDKASSSSSMKNVVELEIIENQPSSC